MLGQKGGILNSFLCFSILNDELSLDVGCYGDATGDKLRIQTALLKICDLFRNRHGAF